MLLKATGPGDIGRFDLPSGAIMSCGTVPAIGGIRPARRFIMQRHDPVLNRTVEHDYAIETLPLVS